MSSQEIVTLKCQYCLERQLEPNEAIGLWQKLPICDACLGPILDNQTDINREFMKDDDNQARLELAFKLLDQLEEIYDQWPFSADETLSLHEHFYNHKPPAIINCSLKEIEQIYQRRKGILFTVRHKDERWATDIDNLKRSLREEANLTGIQTSRKEKGKVVSLSGVKKQQLEKLAKQLGVSVELLLQQGAKKKQEEFEELVGTKELPKFELEPSKESVKSVLDNLKTKTQAKSEPLKINPFTGKPYLK